MAPVSKSSKGSVSSTSKKSSALKTRVSQASVMRRHIDVVHAIQEVLALPPLLTAAEREALRARAMRVPVSFVEAAAAAAEDAGGHIAGVPLDADDSRSTLAYLAASESLLGAIDALARALRDDLLVKRAQLTDRAMAGYIALSGMQRLPEGVQKRGVLNGLRAALKRPRKRPAKDAKPIAANPDTRPVASVDITGTPALAGFAGNVARSPFLRDSITSRSGESRVDHPRGFSRSMAAPGATQRVFAATWP